MTVTWSDRAKSRLREIHDYIAADSPSRAKSVVDHLLRRSAQLAVAPQVGREVPEYRQADLREVLERPFRLIDLVRRAEIVVITVKHYRQRLPERPADL